MLLSSCASEKAVQYNNSIIINLDQATQTDSIRLSHFFKRAHIINLDQSSSDALIGSISRIEIQDSLIIVLDRNIANKVFIFNTSGEFIRTIGNSGQGKGEYTSPSDFSIDYSTYSIFISDRQQHKILKYDLRSGEFISSFKNPSLSTNMLYYSDAIYADNPKVWSTESRHLIRKLDAQTGKEQEMLYSPDIYNKGWSFSLFNFSGLFLSRSSYEPKFTHLFMDTVYRFTKEGIYPYLSIHSKEMMRVDDIAGLDVDRNPMDLAKIVQANRFHNLYTYIENNNFILFQLQKGVIPHTVYYNKSKGTTSLSKNLIDDVLFNNGDFKFTKLEFGGSNSSGAYFYLSPERLSGFIDFIKTGALSGSGADSIGKESNNDNFNGAIIYYEYKD